MNRGSTGARSSVAGGRQRTSVAAELATPRMGTGTGNCSSGGARHSLLPRPGAARGSSVKMTPRTGSAASVVGGTRLSRGARQSSVGGLPRLSVAGPSLTRATPSRNPLSASNYLAPPSSTNRLSTESRASMAGRQKRKDCRPLTDPSFKKRCVDNVFAFLLNNGYGETESIAFNRRTIVNPSTKDFIAIYSFIYSKLDTDYKIPTRLHEEISQTLKILQYPAQISKSTFVTVGSMHSWPTLLAMLSWLCDIIESIVSCGPQEMAFPTDFETNANAQWQVLNLHLEASMKMDGDDREEYFQRHKEDVFTEAGCSHNQLGCLEKEVKALQLRHQSQQQEHCKLPEMRTTNKQLNEDIGKLVDYNKKLEHKMLQQVQQPAQQQQEIESRLLKHRQLEEANESLEALKASQSFTPAELLSIKNHEKTSASSVVQLQQQLKHSQEKTWEVEMSQCRAQVTLSEYIQKYNNSHAASDVVVIACGSDPSVAQSVGGLAARLEESELCNLMAKLTEAVRIGRVKLMEQHAITNNQEQECRSLTEQVDEGKQHVTQMKQRIANLEEDISFTRHEIDTEEAAMIQLRNQYQKEASALRKAPRPELFTMRQEMATLQKQSDDKKQELYKMTIDGINFLVKVKVKISEAQKFEKEEAVILKEKFIKLFPPPLRRVGGGHPA